MRFLIYVSLLLAVLPIVFTRPFFGLCVYYVVSLMQPKLLCWRPAFQDAMLVGVPLVIGAVAIGVKRKDLAITLDPATRRAIGAVPRIVRGAMVEAAWPLGLCAVLTLYIALTRLIVPYPLHGTSDQFRSLCKIVFVTALLTGLACDLGRFRILYLVVALSVAFWAIKGGLKVIVLGPHQVYGKTYDNNLFALTSVMTLPMVFYFAVSVRHARWRALLLVCAALMCIAIVGSHSRAGFVAFAFVLAGMAWSSRYRLRAVAAAGLVAVVLLATSGKEIQERIQSIRDYQHDRSARSRFATWEVARQLLVRSPLIGVGFANFEAAKDAHSGGRKAAHNIYLQNLAELGLLGHPLWLALVFGSLFSIYRFMRRTRGLPPDMRWAYHWSRGLFLGMAAFCIHGLFHNEEYLELMFTIIGLNIALQSVTRRELLRRRFDDATPQRATARASVPVSTRPAAHPGALYPAARRLRPA